MANHFLLVFLLLFSLPTASEANTAIWSPPASGTAFSKTSRHNHDQALQTQSCGQTGIRLEVTGKVLLALLLVLGIYLCIIAAASFFLLGSPVAGIIFAGLAGLGIFWLIRTSIRLYRIIRAGKKQLR
ncbi:MAG: hypothetical protein EP344_12190 [Bacteroidetes bacterium]|nr:MAG: hypothetical protein EP344_12190 [Bacteroidota bacterium]